MYNADTVGVEVRPAEFFKGGRPYLNSTQHALNVLSRPLVKVCDSIMGSGKTSAAINMMNEHPEQRFIYVTPLLDEDMRIVLACPALHFARPGFVGTGSKRYTKGDKSDHLLVLLQQGRNIATTHALFHIFTPEAFELARQQNYTMIIDEEPPVLDICPYGMDDFKMLERTGWLVRHDDGTFWVRDGRFNGRLNDLVTAARTNRLMNCSKHDNPKQMWAMSEDLFKAFKEVYFLTFMFDSSVLQCYMRVRGMCFENIYVNRDQNGRFSFTDHVSYLPAYIPHLPELIHICEDDELNAVGLAHNALSSTWYKNNVGKQTRNAKQLKSAMRRYFTEYCRDVHGDRRMWTCFKDFNQFFMRNGWRGGFVSSNTKSTNIYSDKKCLAYLCNTYLHPDVMHYAKHHGVQMDSDGYAVSMMVQWIWRSAIRNGEEIYIFVPSSRMRRLLKEWMDNCIREYNELYVGGLASAAAV